MRRFVSRPGTEAYCGRSLEASHDSGGLFHPGTAVDPWLATGGDETLGSWICGAVGFLPASCVGAVTGGGLPAPEDDSTLDGEVACAAADNGRARATPGNKAPKRCVRNFPMSLPPSLIAACRRRATPGSRPGT